MVSDVNLHPYTAVPADHIGAVPRQRWSPDEPCAGSEGVVESRFGRVDRIIPFLVMRRCLTQENEGSENVSYEKWNYPVDPTDSLPPPGPVREGLCCGGERMFYPRHVIRRAFRPTSFVEFV